MQVFSHTLFSLRPKAGTLGIPTHIPLANSTVFDCGKIGAGPFGQLQSCLGNRMQTIIKSRQPLRLPQELAAAMERSQQLMNVALERVAIARELRETSINLRQINKDFREFLRENCLAGLSLCDGRDDGE